MNQPERDGPRQGRAEEGQVGPKMAKVLGTGVPREALEDGDGARPAIGAGETTPATSETPKDAVEAAEEDVEAREEGREGQMPKISGISWVPKRALR